MLKTLAVVLIVSLALALVLSCAPQAVPAPAKPSAPAPAPGPSASPTPSAASPKPSPAAAQPKSGGIFRYWANGAPAGFDTHRKPSYAPIVCRPIFNGLLRFDLTKREIIPENIVGDLAERYEVSADGKTWTFFLQKGVKWHDGAPFSADDVVYSLNKMVDPKTSAIAGTLGAFDKVEKVDANTVKIYLKTPSPSLLVQLAGPFTSMQAKHKASVDWRSTDFLVGTGPFKYKSSAVGINYQSVKNPDYFRKGLPYLDGLNLTIIADRSAQVDAFATGQVEMTSVISGIPNKEALDRFRSQIKDAVLVQQAVQQGSVFWFNVERERVKDPRVRRAIALMVDPKEITDAGYGSEEWATYENAFMPAPYGLPKAEIDKLLGRGKPLDARIAEAKKLMADAGLASGFKLRYLVRSLPEQQRQVNVLADLCRRHLNIDPDIVAREATEARRVRDSKDFDLYLDQALNLMGEPDELMPYFVTGVDNFMGYSNPAADKLWAQQSQTMDLAKRRQLTQEIERVLLTDVPAIPTTFMAYFTAWRPEVKGWVLQNASYASNICFEVVWLDK